MSSAVRAFVAFGANLGDPVATFDDACNALAALSGTALTRRSSLYRSAPIGVGEDQPDYVNGVIELNTTLPAGDLLNHLLSIELDAGRTRDGIRAPRTLDLDLLLYGALVIHTANLDVPHPRMHERAFVLAPLVEIAPEAEIPGRGAAAALLPGVINQRITRL